jgi:hypothetical protein
MGLATSKAQSVVFGKQGSVLPIHIVKADLRAYRHLIVEPATTLLGKRVPDSTLKKISEDLIGRVNGDDAITMFAYDSGSEPSLKEAIRLKTEVLDYEEGSRTQRTFTFGGEAFIIIRYTVTDSETGATLAVFNSRGFLKDSLWFGGVIDEAIAEANSGVLSYLRGKLEPTND